jgi:hypothetical protein
MKFASAEELGAAAVSGRFERWTTIMAGDAGDADDHLPE